MVWKEKFLYQSQLQGVFCWLMNPFFFSDIVFLPQKRLGFKNTSPRTYFRVSLKFEECILQTEPWRWQKFVKKENTPKNTLVGLVGLGFLVGESSGEMFGWTSEHRKRFVDSVNMDFLEVWERQLAGKFGELKLKFLWSLTRTRSRLQIFIESGGFFTKWRRVGSQVGAVFLEVGISRLNTWGIRWWIASPRVSESYVPRFFGGSILLRLLAEMIHPCMVYIYLHFTLYEGRYIGPMDPMGTKNDIIFAGQMWKHFIR